jgi:hypothetical protein
LGAHALALAALHTAAPAKAQAVPIARLLAAYPAALAGVTGNTLLWRDGTAMDLDAGATADPETDAGGASIRQQAAAAYPQFAAIEPPDPEENPGRARNTEFFRHLYGDCRANEVAPHLAPVVWLPQSWGKTVQITTISGVDRHLRAVSAEIDAMPEDIRRFAYPTAGTYNCRAIAGTRAQSAHSYGIAIDLNTENADYWRWERGGWRNRIPAEIVAAFERHGFIWGGRWSRYDTMHFEYRPELLPVPPPDDEGTGP